MSAFGTRCFVCLEQDRSTGCTPGTTDQGEGRGFRAESPLAPRRVAERFPDHAFRVKGKPGKLRVPRIEFQANEPAVLFLEQAAFAHHAGGVGAVRQETVGTVFSEVGLDL